MNQIFSFLFTLILGTQALAMMDLPTKLDRDDRQRALQILGFGSAAKILDNPYPLGGYSGVEVGITSEFIPLEDLASLGDKTSDKGDLNYYTITLGKGLYYNVDTFVYFTPSVQSHNLTNFGGQIRWGFYEASFFPLALTAVASASGANFDNLLNVSNFGLDLVGTVNIENVALYFGYGRCRSIGTFIGGANGITDTGETIQADIIDDHTLFGVNIDFSKLFVALQVDRYADSTYSGKIGFRF